MSTEDQIPEVLRAVVVGPDDHLLLTVPITIAQDDLAEFSRAMRERFGDRVTIVAGVDEVAVIQPGASHDAT